MSLVPNITISQTSDVSIGSEGIIIADKLGIHSIVPVIEQDIYTQIAAPDAQSFFRRIVENLLQRYVPVRTGKLLDTLLQTLRVDVIGANVVISATTPSGYPVVITNPAHSGVIGYGKKYTPLNVIKNRNKIRDTPKGAYYLLNDAEAVSDYETILQNYIAPRITPVIEQIPFEYDIEIRYVPTFEDLPVGSRIINAEQYRGQFDIEGSIAIGVPYLDKGEMEPEWNIYDSSGKYVGTLTPDDCNDIDYSEIDEEFDEDNTYYDAIDVTPVAKVSRLVVAWQQEEYYEGDAVDMTEWDSEQ